MVAGLDLTDHGRRDRGHAACRRAGGLRPFERGHALLEGIDGGIGVPAVAVARLLVQEAPFGALGALVDEALGQEQRFRRLAEGRAIMALMDKAGFEVVFVFLRQGHEPILKLFFKKNNRLLFAEKLLGSVSPPFTARPLFGSPRSGASRRAQGTGARVGA